MSHQTGITANDELLRFFGDCKSGHYRAAKVSIIQEELRLVDTFHHRGNWESDFDSIVPKLVVDKQPCFVLFRLDVRSASGYEWLLISWSPDDSPVREKMLYASTKATFKKLFGSITEEFFATRRDEATAAGYVRHKRDYKGPGPLTTAEEELRELNKLTIESTSPQGSISGIAFPMSKEAKDRLQSFGRGEIDYVQLSLDILNERINLERADACDVRDFNAILPGAKGRYHLFRYKHAYDGDYLDSVVFVYVIPGAGCSIKERMLSSSCKGPVTDTIENAFRIPIAKKIEIDVGVQVDDAFLLDELHPKSSLHRPKFSKPKGPSNRGPRRLLKDGIQS
ncbi:unnamed protein product [Notodromas monacha]|uniref:Twinfilin n=1 Tax=Notodromas monacha TaxID=399045 RepID=A0A7R9BHL7_9CRUS|nr:unnamed protein product [Notodromas monacha]CAG0915645.1 unnamed protein product [Notodromas monacha]